MQHKSISTLSVLQGPVWSSGPPLPRDKSSGWCNLIQHSYCSPSPGRPSGPRLTSPSALTPPSSQLPLIENPWVWVFPSLLPLRLSDYPRGAEAMAVPSAQEFHWQSLARLSSGRVYHTLTEVGGQMYMLGGCDAAGRPCGALELYSPEVTNWKGN